MKAFPAKYDGHCGSEDCNFGDNRIESGDSMTYHEDVIMHEGCATRAARGHGPLCASCFTEHRGECP